MLVSEVVAMLYAGQQRSEVAENLVIVLPVLSVIVALYAGVWPYVEE